MRYKYVSSSSSCRNVSADHLSTGDVVSKGLIPDAAARDLYRFYHEELSGFIAILDYQDPYELVRETNPATFNAVMAIACRRHHNSGPFEAI